MNELFPIVRRVRRPLVVADVPPVAGGSVESVKAKPEGTASIVSDKPSPTENEQRTNQAASAD